MSILYKRYVPPKAPTASVASDANTPNNNVSASKVEEAPNKRKRERTEEEVADRKAKKLRKKGAEDDSAKSADNGTTRKQKAPKRSQKRDERSRPKETAGKPSITLASPEPVESTPIVDGEGAKSEFAHVKDTKKRHKLEKEARKARKAAERETKQHSEDHEESVGADAVGVNGSHHEHSDAAAQSEHQVAARTLAVTEQPEKRRKKRKDVVNQTGEQQATDSNTVDVESATEARPKSKDRNDEVQSSTIHGDEALNDRNIAVVHESHKRRHKLESVFRGPLVEAGEPSNNEDGELRKHGNVLGKFQKSMERSQKTAPQEVLQNDDAGEEPIVLDLAPLPQPEEAQLAEFKADPDALPKWLSHPTMVSSDARATFARLGLDVEVVQHLTNLNFVDALPVQQALIPLLLPPGAPGARFLPATEAVLPDVAVSAPTGSGKTLAYLLPTIESLKTSAGSGRLKAVVVVPTRELVVQVATVAENLVKGSGVRVGTSTGSGSFKDEQAKLVRQGRRYDPEAYHRFMAKAHTRNYPGFEGSVSFDEFVEALEHRDEKEEKRVEDAIACLVDHVPTYESVVDILVATPGRLLEHLNNTLGFSLAYLQWLVLDEADKLIDQQYDGFLPTVLAELSRSHDASEQDAREVYLRSLGYWNESTERRVRKVVLSATMTRDISKLMDLNLSRPRMIVVRGNEEKSTDSSSKGMNVPDKDHSATGMGEDGFELPPNLREYCIPVGDGSDKPLHLIELLSTRVLPTQTKTIYSNDMVQNDAEDESSRSDAEDTSSAASSTSSSSDSASDSDSESTSDISSDGSERPNSEPTEQDLRGDALHPDRALMLQRFQKTSLKPAEVPAVLIFTSSTESAHRLSHLLKTLQPDWSPFIATMTKTSTDKHSRGTSAQEQHPSIVIATDRAGRGLDTISKRHITHVIQYDVPRSVTGYVHRVGRTARAGRAGEAWTLYTHSEARWFLNEITKAGKGKITRAEAVEKVKLVVSDEGLRERLGEAVRNMREEVFGGGSKRGGRA